MEQASQVMDNTNSLVLWLCQFLVLLKRKHRLSDASITLLLSFFVILFKIIAIISPNLSGLVEHFPPTIHRLQKLLSKGDVFKRYVACEKCYTIYNYEDCVDRIGINEAPRLCSHRNLRHGRPCKGKLIKKVELSRGRITLHPIKIFCYAPLLVYMQSLLNRPNFVDLCNHWKQNHNNDGIYRDVYDGALWHEFQVYNGKPFLSDPFTFGLMLNIDWFRPCKHVEYSIGAIYLTVMNLPRMVRFRQENVMLVGLIPGPKEPKHDINSQLQPLVEELVKFWEGIYLNFRNTRTHVRCALLYVAANIPALRKICNSYTPYTRDVADLFARLPEGA